MLKDILKSNKYLGRDYCFQNNTDFKLCRLPSSMIIIRKKDDSPALQDCIENLNQYLNNSKIMKDSRTTKAGITKLTDQQDVFIKCFNNKGIAYTVRYIFREARPFRVWRAAWAMEKAGIPTPQLMAAIAKYKCGLPCNAYLIRYVVPNVISTIDFFKKLKDSAELRNSYIEAVAAIFAKMHNAGIYHGDAKCSNIYIEDRGNNQFAYGVWDLLSCKIKPKPISQNLRNKELSRIAWSFSEITKRIDSDIEEYEIKKQLENKYRSHL